MMSTIDGNNHFYTYSMRLFLILSLFPLSMSFKYMLVPAQLNSHTNEQMFVGQALVDRGHEVYLAAADTFPWESRFKHTGVSVVYYTGSGSKAHTGEYRRTMGEFLKKGSGGQENFRIFEYTSVVVQEDCEAMMNDPTFIQNVKDLQIDMMLTDGFMLSPCTSILPRFLGIPFASMFSSYLYGGALPMMPSFVPSIFATTTDEMTFFERIKNTINFIADGYLLPFTGVRNTSLIDRYPDPKGTKASSWHDVLSRGTLFFVTRDHLLDWPMPTMPHYISLPGISLRPAKALNPELENFLTSSKNGVVLVSFGSLNEHIDPKVLQKLYAAFRQLPDVKFILKALEGAVTETLENVKIQDWIPQNDLLAHPNLKIFVTHCGNNGQYESVYHGVPMIGLPHFAEQPHNCHRIHVKGLGICMDSNSFTSREFADNIKLIMDNPDYKLKTTRLSAILKEGQLPKDKAAYWMEHVIRYGGDHIKSRSLDMPTYQYWMLDIAALAFLIAMLFLAMFTIFTLRLCRYVKVKVKKE